MIRGKAAELFAAAKSDPRSMAAGKDGQSACHSFGMNLGAAFQVDGALDSAKPPSSARMSA